MALSTNHAIPGNAFKSKFERIKPPLNLLFYETRFRLINTFYFFSFINNFLFDIFKIIAVSPLIRIKQIIALLFSRDYRIYALKKFRILK